MGLLEVSENKRRCKSVNNKVANKGTVKEFHEKVENQQNIVNLTIENEIPDCIACRVCETVGPNQAITVKEE